MFLVPILIMTTAAAKKQAANKQATTAATTLEQALDAEDALPFFIIVPPRLCETHWNPDHEHGCTAVCPAASREKYLQLRMAARNTKEAFSVIPDEEAALREQYRKRAELAHSPFEEQEEMAQWVLDTCQHAAAAAALDAVGFHKFELHEMPQSYQDQVLGKNLQKKSKKRKKGSRRNAYRTEL